MKLSMNGTDLKKGAVVHDGQDRNPVVAITCAFAAAEGYPICSNETYKGNSEALCSLDVRKNVESDFNCYRRILEVVTLCRMRQSSSST